MGRKVAFLATALTLVLMGAGCSKKNSPEPVKSSPAPTTSAAPTAAALPTFPTTGPDIKPGETPPTLAAVGQTNTPAGAFAFADFYVAAIDWASKSMNSAALKQLSLTACKTCQENLIAEIDHDAAQNRHWMGSHSQITFRVLDQNDGTNGATEVIRAHLNIADESLVSSAGSVIRTATGASGVYQFYLKWQGGHWMMAAIRH
ncbi:hypothetical protein SAMN05892883_3936 [Jatrophihabitans sp. GAS493]|uniref:DUF6318 family protein n=1 Tax=Jatrophihabitans sp. GAS493 TaxID=1907575 RepID=UPI000BBFEB1C|nr:DUF6318 family protein [Jatrophihabitans sp. GAS493]SOD74745.1 hypothetical protein SAMN05892883_3936 [Jatrophihabitans sp. GAS493]